MTLAQQNNAENSRPSSARKKWAWARLMSPVSSGALEQRVRRRSSRWTPTSRTIRSTCRGCSSFSSAERCRDRLALRPGRRNGELGPRPQDPEPRRKSLFPPDPGRPDPRFHGRLQRLAQGSPRSRRSRDASARTAIHSRSSSSTALSSRTSRWSNSRSFSRTAKSVNPR